VANTLPYDAILLEGYTAGRPLPAGQWDAVTVPVLVLDGSKSPVAMRHAARALASVLPNARHQTMEGQSHRNPSWKTIAPVLAGFFGSPAAGR
jgi:pimeloyl-ACP methyl ester carboxylesterase